MNVLSIDPGNSGSLCYFQLNNENKIINIEFFDIKTIKNEKISKKRKVIDINSINNYIKNKKIDKCFIELIHARPTDSKIGAFSFGFNYSALITALHLNNIEYNTISPLFWKRKQFLFKKEKEESIKICINKYKIDKNLFETKRGKLLVDRADSFLLGITAIENNK